MNIKLRIAAFALVTLSFTFSSLVIMFVAGTWNTPFSATDTAGRTMGFNDRLSPQHYGIVFSNFEFKTLFFAEYLYSWLLLLMHVCGAWLLVRHPYRVQRFFVAQGVIFPLGWGGLFALPSIIGSICRGSLDREGIIDIPFIALMAQPIWVLTAILIFATARRAFIRSAVPNAADERRIATR
jgi:hypothetical protein